MMIQNIQRKTEYIRIQTEFLDVSMAVCKFLSENAQKRHFLTQKSRPDQHYIKSVTKDKTMHTFLCLYC